MKAINGHTMAYVAIYGESPPEIQVGQKGSTRLWRGHKIDSNLKDKWLKAVNDIRFVEVVSLCGGHGPLRPSHIIFYFKHKRNDKEAVEISGILNNIHGLWSIVDEGNRGRPRICVAAPVRADTPKGNIWWSTISGIIDDCLIIDLDWIPGEKT